MSDPLNLSWITSELAIGGSFPSTRADELARDHRIGAVIDLRWEDHDNCDVLARHGVAFLHLPTIDHDVVSPPMLRDGVAFAVGQITAGRRVLVHCQCGIGRSALLALCVLVERGHAPLDALVLAKDRRTLVCPNQRQYEAWASWLRARAVEPPTFEAFAAVAYRNFVTR